MSHEGTGGAALAISPKSLAGHEHKLPRQIHARRQRDKKRSLLGGTSTRRRDLTSDVRSGGDQAATLGVTSTTDRLGRAVVRAGCCTRNLGSEGGSAGL